MEILIWCFYKNENPKYTCNFILDIIVILENYAEIDPNYAGIEP